MSDDSKPSFIFYTIPFVYIQEKMSDDSKPSFILYTIPFIYIQEKMSVASLVRN